MKLTVISLVLFFTLSSLDISKASSNSGFKTPLNGWYKYACSAENIKRSRTYYCDSRGRIICMPGWTDEASLCSVPICEIAGQTCIHGNCSKPFTCDCEIGWTGQFCDKCVCLPGCVNGYCNKSLECVCEPGWSGMLCDQPVCGGCFHGECVMPGMCICDAGWSGPNCTICEERSDCQFGRCLNEPFECACYDGYYGSSCETPVCREGCDKKNGFCMMPDTCICKDGWTGPNCTQCVPYWNCQHGTCKKPWECICDPGFFGLECSENATVNGLWGQWSTWSTCSTTCGSGTQTRRRHCDNPPKSGNGTYCSIDGSSSRDTRPCNLQNCSIANVNGTWGQWSTYSSCSASCGAGNRTRTRLCDNPAPSGSGAPCSGSAIDVTDCIGIPSCIPNIDGQWGLWGAFGPCSSTCGNGTQTRTRICDSPAQSGSGAPCSGSSLDVQNCNGGTPCPIDGGYTQWTDFSPCTSTCIGDIGNSTRRRYCTNPTPMFGGQNCTAIGPDREFRFCNGTIPRQSTDPTQPCFTIFS